MKTEHIDQLTKLQESVSKIKIDAKVEFIENLKQLFLDNPTLDTIKIRINNHEFNDGDPTNFSLYYEDMEVTDTDNNIFERNDYGCKDPDRNRTHPLVAAAFNIFNKYNIADLHENFFGDSYDSYLEISRHNVSDITNN